MQPHDERLRDRLIAQQEPTPEQLARYRTEVDALLEQLRRRRVWIDAVRAVLTTLGAIVLFPLAALFGLMFLYLLLGGADPRRGLVACHGRDRVPRRCDRAGAVVLPAARGRLAAGSEAATGAGA